MFMIRTNKLFTNVTVLNFVQLNYVIYKYVHLYACEKTICVECYGFKIDTPQTRGVLTIYFYFNFFQVIVETYV